MHDPYEYPPPPLPIEPLYKRTWFIVCLLIFFPPVGIILSWIHKKPANMAARIVLTILALSIASSAISSFKKQGEQRDEQARQSIEDIQPQDNFVEAVDLTNLLIGAVARFKDYAISLDTANSDGQALTAQITIIATNDFTFACKNLTGEDDQGASYDYQTSSSEEKATVIAGDSLSAVLSFPDKGISSLHWRDGNNEAVWTFEANAAALAAAQSDESSAFNDLENVLSTFDAWRAVQSCGESQYPYGFKLHYFIGKITEEHEDNSWHLVATCDITNAFNATAKNRICEAFVTQNDHTLTVTSFSVS